MPNNHSPRSRAVNPAMDSDTDSQAPGSDPDETVVFDPEAMLRAMHSPETVAAPPAKGKAKPDKAKPASKAEEATGDDPEDDADDDDSSPESAATDDEEEDTADDEEETEDDDSPDDLLKNPEALLKAHEEIKAKAAKRAARIKELETALADRPAAREGAAVVLEPTMQHPLSNVATPADLAEAETFWKAEKAWCRQHRDGGTRKDAKGNEVEWTADDVAAREDLAVELLSTGISQRKAYLAENQASIAAAHQKFPFLAPNHALAKSADEWVSPIIRRAPDISQLAEWPELMSKAYVGHLVTEGTHAVSRGKDGKLTIVSLGDKSKAAATAVAAPAKKSPPVRAAATAPPAKKAGSSTDVDAAIAAAFARNDYEEASRLMTTVRLTAA